MLYTEFSEFAGDLRSSCRQKMGDMARTLGVSPAFLSAVENGRKKVPDGWLSLMTEKYALLEEEKAELSEMIELSKLQCRIDLRHADLSKRKAAIEFAKLFKCMNDDAVIKILKVLEEEKSRIEGNSKRRN